MKAAKKLTAIAPVSNDAAEIIGFEEPYSARISVVGTAPILFHRWSVDSVEAKGKASKGSKAKKTDDVESYVYRDEKGLLGIPTEYFRMSIVGASKFRQDPRSPRKSAMDLFRAGIANLTDICSLGVRDWDFLDKRRVTIQRSGITRTRPAMLAGWKVTFEFSVLLPEYISPGMLNETVTSAGRLVGIGDFRPTYGRFQIVSFECR